MFIHFYWKQTESLESAEFHSMPLKISLTSYILVFITVIEFCLIICVIVVHSYLINTTKTTKNACQQAAWTDGR